MKKLLVFILLVSFNFGTSQNYKCTSLSNLIQQNGTELYEDTQFRGSAKFLQKIEFFKYNDEIYAIVKFKSTPKYYVYCNVPKTSITNFENDENINKGKRYHKYIKPYKCDCD